MIEDARHVLDAARLLGDAKHQLEVLHAVERGVEPAGALDDRSTHQEEMADVHDPAEELGRPIRLEERLAVPSAQVDLVLVCVDHIGVGPAVQQVDAREQGVGVELVVMVEERDELPGGRLERPVRRSGDALVRLAEGDLDPGVAVERPKVLEGGAARRSVVGQAELPVGVPLGPHRVDAAAQPRGIRVVDGRDDRDERPEAEIGRRDRGRLARRSESRCRASVHGHLRPPLQTARPVRPTLGAPQRAREPPRGRADDILDVSFAFADRELEPPLLESQAIVLGAASHELGLRLVRLRETACNLPFGLFAGVECPARLALGRLGLLPGELGARTRPACLPDGLGAASQGGEEGGGDGVDPRAPQERGESLVRLDTDGKDAEPVPVGEGEGRVRRFDLVPQPPDAELRLVDVRVVEQEDSPLAELRQPGLEVMCDGVVAVSAVDVEQVDRAVGEGRRRIVERSLEEAREGSVSRVVVLAELLEHLGTVSPCVLVALPGVHGVGAGRQLECMNGLAETAVRVSLPGPELDEHGGAEDGDGEERERYVLLPAVDVGEPERLLVDDGVAERLEGHRRAFLV